jgi:hypothetical protein
MIEQIIHNLSSKFNFLRLKSTSKINKYHHASVVHPDISNKKNIPRITFLNSYPSKSNNTPLNFF